MNTKVKEIRPVDDEKAGNEKVSNEAAEDKLITEDELNKFRQAFSNVLSARQLNRMNEYQAQKEYNTFLMHLQNEIGKLDNPVATGLFELQADIYKAMHMPPPPR